MLKAFIKSILIGSLAGAWLPLIFTVFATLFSLPAGLSTNDGLLGTLYIAFLPLLVALTFVAPCMVVIGLPATIILRRMKAESKDAYITVGAIAGFLIPILALVHAAPVAALLLAILGAFSGGVTARTWWSAICETVESNDPSQTN